MLASNIPANFNIPFANGAGAGFIRTVPQASQIGISPGAASLQDGFPPLNFTPIATGGIPPAGQDMNGVLNAITKSLQWLQAGGLPVYNAALSASIGGYPNGAILVNNAGSGFWHSNVDNNITNPDTGGAGWTAVVGAAGGGGGSVAWTSVTGRPTALSQFTNDPGFITSASLIWTAISGRPTALSQFTNDIGAGAGSTVNSIGYLAYTDISANANGVGQNPANINEGQIITILGRPGSWLVSDPNLVTGRLVRRIA